MSSDPTWALELCVSSKGTTTTVTLPQNITGGDLLRHISATTNISPGSLRVLCAGVIIEATDDVALQTYSVLKDGVTVQIMGEPGVPVATERLWCQVGIGLEKSQTIVWKDSVDALEAVKKHFSDDQARNFANTHLCGIVAIMIAQNPTKIGMKEREAVRETLRLAAEIVSMDLQIASSGNLLESLGYLFNPKQTYVKESKKSGVIGQGTVTLSEIASCFSKQDGFINLATYMAQNTGAPGFPGPKVVAYVVDFLRDSGPDHKLGSLQNKAATTVIVKTSIDHLLACDEDYLREIAENVIILKKLRRALLEAVRGETVMTDCDESQLWDLWSSLVLRIIDAELPITVRKSGWAAWHDMMEWSVEAIHSNEKLIVRGAGTDFVNGLYTPTTINDELAYTRNVPDGFGDASGKKLTCFQCTMRSRQKWWFISEADQEQPGTDRDVDYYQLKSAFQKTPQLDGWVICKQHGLSPPPTLEFTGALSLPEEQARGLPPFRFCCWVQNNGLLAKAESDEAYSEYISGTEKPENMYSLLSLLRYGTSDEVRSIGLLADVRFQELHHEMNSCKKGTDEALRVLKEFSKSSAQFNTATATLKEIVENILTKRDEKYRKIRVLNAQFQEKLGGCRGADQLMKAVGFCRNQNSDGVEFYTYNGSIFGLLAVKNSLDEDPRRNPRTWQVVMNRAVASANEERAIVEDQMIAEAIARSLADADGNHGGQPGE